MDLVEDLKVINSLSCEGFGEISKLLPERDDASFEYAKATQELRKKYGKDEVAAVFRFMEFLSRNLVDARDFKKKLEKVNDRLSRFLDDEQEALSGWEKVRGSLDSAEAFFLKEKENDIKERFSRITKFEITTDVRPIFNLGRTDIVKHVYPCILKVETIDDEVFLCELYEEKIEELISELELAKEKIHKMKLRYD